MNSSDIHFNIDKFFSKTKDLLNDNYQELFDDQAIKLINRPSRLPLGELIRVLNKLNVTLDSVIENKIDYDVLTSHYASQDAMPARYMEKAALSSRFTGAYVINHIASTQGEKSAKHLMQNFQLKESQFKDTLQKNNLLLCSDLCDYIYKYYGEEEVFQMGQHSASLLRNTFQGKLLAQSDNLDSMFELFFEEIAPIYVERNYSWKIVKFDSDSLTVSGEPTAQIKDAFNEEVVYSPSLQILRKGFLKALPDLFGSYHVEVDVLKSIQEGDECDMYKLSYKQLGHRPRQIQ